MVINSEITKYCSKCSTTKSTDEFPNKKSTKDGKYPYCKICKRSTDNLKYKEHSERKKIKAREYYHNNRDQILERIKSNPKNNERCKQWRKTNSEYFSKYKKSYNKKNKDKISLYSKKYKESHRVESNLRRKQNLEKYPYLKIIKNLRKRLREVLLSNGGYKSDSYTDSIGCDHMSLKIHLEKQFKPDMTWDNYGTLWNIDHMIPLSCANNESQMYELNHYLNLKPVYSSDNFSKGNKRSDICWQKLKRDKLIQEDKEAGLPFDLKASDFTLSHESIGREHRDFIERYEWLGSCGYGIRQTFTARYNGKLAGVILIAEPNGYQFGIEREALIQRGACASWAPKNLNSRLLMFACRWMSQNTSKRIFTAYSDFSAGEYGTIYQACNFDYLGQSFGSKSSLILPNGKKVTDRYFTRTSAMKKWCKELGIKWEDSWCKENGYQDTKNIPQDVKNAIKEHIAIIKESCKRITNDTKGKYVLLLKRNKREKLEKTWTCLPYPKRDGEPA